MSKRTWKQRGLRLLFIFLIPYLLVAVLVSLFESRLVYPNRGAGGFELTTNISGLSLVSFKTTDGLVLRGMFYNPENSEGVVLFCHGNGEWIGRHEQWVPSLGDSLNMAVLSYDYRGYGDSEGSPYEDGLIRDGQAAYQFLIDAGFKAENILVFGRSLGGGVACAIAEKNPIGGLFLQNTFSSMVDVGASRFFWLPVRLIMRNRFPSDDRIKNYAGPLLQCHGTNDHVVPIRFGMKLFDSARTDDARKTFITVEGGGHNDPLSNETRDKLYKLAEQIKQSPR